MCISAQKLITNYMFINLHTEMNLKGNSYCFFAECFVNLLCNSYALQSAECGRRKHQTK